MPNGYFCIMYQIGTYCIVAQLLANLWLCVGAYYDYGCTFIQYIPKWHYLQGIGIGLARFPRQFEFKRLMTLAALAVGPNHSYGIRQQIMDDTQDSFIPSLVTQQRVLEQFCKLGLIDLVGYRQYGSRDLPIYEITKAGRRLYRSQIVQWFNTCQRIDGRY